MNLLIIGALPPPVGGTTILFKQLVDDLRTRSEVRLRLIDVSRPQVTAFGDVVHGIKCLFALLWHLPHVSIVSLHVSTNGALWLGPLVHALVRLSARKWICRIFGGDLDERYANASLALRRVFDSTVLRADVILLERKSSVRFFQERSRSPIDWYPNSRSMPSGAAPRRVECGARRFVFLGHVKPAKGIRELIAAARLCAQTDVSVDVFGPLQEGVTAQDFLGSPVRYLGPLDAAQVVVTLAEYDVLVLPTYWQGEGYPGVILEAYGAGLAVIATRWGGIPEIVTQESGILVEPRDVHQLAAAMRGLIDSGEKLNDLRAGARRKAVEFDSTRWAQHFVDVCRSLTATQGR